MGGRERIGNCVRLPFCGKTDGGDVRTEKKVTGGESGEEQAWGTGKGGGGEGEEGGWA